MLLAPPGALEVMMMMMVEMIIMMVMMIILMKLMTKISKKRTLIMTLSRNILILGPITL